MGKEREIAIGKEGAPGPFCPHCSKELHHVNDHQGKVKMMWELHVLSCPHCRKVLEVRTIPK